MAQPVSTGGVNSEDVNVPRGAVEISETGQAEALPVGSVSAGSWENLSGPGVPSTTGTSPGSASAAVVAESGVELGASQPRAQTGDEGGRVKTAGADGRGQDGGLHVPGSMPFAPLGAMQDVLMGLSGSVLPKGGKREVETGRSGFVTPPSPRQRRKTDEPMGSPQSRADELLRQDPRRGGN